MTIEENKALVRDFIADVMNTGDTAKIADYCVTGTMFADGLAGQIEAMRTPFPDMMFTIDDMIAEGDQVVVKGSSRGTNTGPLIGLPAFGRLETPIPPTDQMTKTGAIYIFTVADGKIVSYTAQIDQFGLLLQLGWTFTPPI